MTDLELELAQLEAEFTDRFNKEVVLFAALKDAVELLEVALVDWVDGDDKEYKAKVKAMAKQVWRKAIAYRKHQKKLEKMAKNKVDDTWPPARCK